MKWHEVATEMKLELEKAEASTSTAGAGQREKELQEKIDEYVQQEKELQEKIEFYEQENEKVKAALTANKTKFKRYVAEREKREAALNAQIGSLKQENGTELTWDTHSIVVTAWKDARADNERLRAEKEQYKSLFLEAELEIKKLKTAAKE